MKRFRPLVFALMIPYSVVISGKSHAQEVNLDTLDAQFSYAVGIQVGMQVVQQLQQLGTQLSGEAVAAGITDILLRRGLRMTEEDMQSVFAAVQDDTEKRRMELIENAKQMGDDFRKEFAKQDNAQSTDSGLLYLVLEKGDGAKPTLDSSVTVDYRGSLVDGSEFDSSYSRNEPTTFGLASIIPGWQEALQLMSVGSKWQLVIPPELAYGDRGAPPAIPPSATLVFEIELLSIQ
jgi:FKBP-type peptidyl-prolyl cis-trans isomerase FklB